MKWLLTVSVCFAQIAIPCHAQNHCTNDAFSQDASRVLDIQASIRKIEVGDMEDAVPPAVASQMTRVKDALSRFSDAVLSCAKPSIDPATLEKGLAELLHANAPEPQPNTVISKNDHRYDEVLGSYGHNLRVQVSGPAEFPGLLTIQYSINIECGSDIMLLIYERHDGVWTQKLRWQSPPLKSIGDAFGDFFLWGLLRASSSGAWRVAVAHGSPWCSSRLSGFHIDLLAPTRDSVSPVVLWHTARGYSRGGFDPQPRMSGDTFELRLNADCMSFDAGNCFERRVIYRYALDSKDHLNRVNPLGLNARGFVEEWLSAPWSESQGFSAAGSADALQEIHDQFDQSQKSDEEYISHSLGPVRTCASPGVFQVQINSTLERMVPGKPGGESKDLPNRYFHVHEVRNGYMMLSAPTEPDPACTGPNLMPAGQAAQ
jgi:hypothetical protein